MSNPNPHMTKQEFEQWFIANYFSWCGRTVRPLTSWLVSVEEYTERRYYDIRREEKRLDAEMAGL